MTQAARRTLLVALLVIGACGGDDTEAADAPTTTAAADDAPTTAPPSTTVAPTTTVLVAGAEDWDGVRFDLGLLDRIDRTEDGRTLVVFDRVQLDVGTDGPQSAPDFDEEPIVYGNTDAPFLNENTRLRTYVAAKDVEVLRISNLRETCADREDAGEATWEEITVDDVVDGALWDEFRQVSLTFGTDGRVTRIRLADGC